MESSAPGSARREGGTGWASSTPLKRAGEALYMGSRLAFGGGSATPSKSAKKAQAPGEPLSDASNRIRPKPAANAGGPGGSSSGGTSHWDPRLSSSSAASASSDRLSTASSASEVGRVTRSRAKIAMSHLQGHPKYNELMGGFPDFSQILSVKIEAKRSDKGKALAEQQGLILQLKEAVSQLTSKRDQLLEIVCTHDDVQWQQEEAFRSRLSAASDEAEERYQKILADRDGKVERMRQLESELAACQVEAALLKKKASETSLAHDALQSLSQKEEDLKKSSRKREEELALIEARISAREEQIAVRNTALDGREAGLDSREQHLASRTAREDERIQAKEAEISAGEVAHAVRATSSVLAAGVDACRLYTPTDACEPGLPDKLVNWAAE